jgi:hypothetical protein
MGMIRALTQFIIPDPFPGRQFRARENRLDRIEGRSFGNQAPEVSPSRANSR